MSKNRDDCGAVVFLRGHENLWKNQLKKLIVEYGK